MTRRKLQEFTKLPSGWIEAGGLRDFRWGGEEGSDNLAALMALTVIAHHIAPENGVARLTYDELTEKASLSRAKIAAGLKILKWRNIVAPEPEGRSTYQLVGYSQTEGWAMFPAKGLYDHHGVVAAFTEFRLRRRAELDAMKLYFLFAARRSRQLNLAKISYPKIEEFSGVSENYIRAALTVLGANGLIHVDRMRSAQSETGVANGYRLTQLYPRQHMGTVGRRDDAELDFAEIIES